MGVEIIARNAANNFNIRLIYQSTESMSNKIFNRTCMCGFSEFQSRTLDELRVKYISQCLEESDGLHKSNWLSMKFPIASFGANLLVSGIVVSKGMGIAFASEIACDKYARIAQLQVALAEQLQCKVEGDSWKPERSYHLDVCKKRQIQNQDSAQVQRNSELMACSRKLSVPGSSEIGGVWSTINKSEDGIGSQWIFAADSRYYFVFGSIAEFSYRISGDRIIMRRSDKGDESQAVNDLEQGFTIEGQKLTFSPENADTLQEFTRIDSRENHEQNIVGDWATIHESGAPAILRISADQKMQWTVPVRLSSGRFEIDVQSGSIRLFENNKSEPQIVEYQIKDDVLQLTDSHDAKTEFQVFR